MSAGGFAALIAVALALAVLGLGLLVALALQARGGAQIQRRLQGADLPLGGEFAAGGTPMLADLARRGQKLEQMVDPDGESPKLLLQAGWRSVPARAAWYAFQGALPVLALGLTGFVWILSPHAPLSRILLTGIAALIVSILLPRMTLRRIAERRRERLAGEVPLFIHLLVLLFEAGLSTRQAIASLVREGRGVLPELGREFELVLRQLEAGGDIADVLRVMGEQLEVADLTGVLAVLRQVDRYGGEVREPLLDTLGILTERRALDLREKVNRMSGTMTIVMVLFFFPALLVFVAGPAFVSIIKALGQVTAHK